MAQGLVAFMKNHISVLKEEIKATEAQLDKYRRLRHGSIVLVDFAIINTVQAGVREWESTDKPTLLQYRDWDYCEEGFRLNFDVLATQEDEPYSSKFQLEYSGLYARIEGPQRYLANAKKKMTHVPIEDLPLYLGWAHITPRFSNLLKGIKQ
jgi:hypothetical protein